MKISSSGINLVKEFEGYGEKLPNGGCKAYRSQLAPGVYDIWTIGWGCTEGVDQNSVWTKKQAEDCLLQELSTFEKAVTNSVKFSPTQNQFDAMVSLAYNIGESGFARSSVLRYANQGDFGKAANAFNLWVKAQGLTLSGLVSRRAKEATLFMTPDGAKSTTPKTSVPNSPQTIDVPASPVTNLLKSYTMWAGGGTAASGAIIALSSLFSWLPTVAQAQGAQSIIEQIVSVFPPTGVYLGIASSLLGMYTMYRRAFILPNS